MSSKLTGDEVLAIANIKRIDVYSSECAETGESVSIMEVHDLDDNSYSMTLTLEQVMDTIMLLVQLRDAPPDFVSEGSHTLVNTESIELIDFPEIN